MKPLYAVLLSTFAALAAPRAASAGPGDAKTASDAEASARGHFQRGQRLSASGKYVEAYREFAAGYALSERPLFLFNMAEAARASGDLAKARENYQQFLRLDPNSALAATARARLAALDAPKPDATGPTTPPQGGSPPGSAGPGTSGGAPAVTATPGQLGEPAPAQRPRLLPPPSSAGAPPGSITTGTASLGRGDVVAHTEEKPMWKKWPFWAVVGGVVAGSALVFAVSRDDSVCGGGCTQLNFR